MTWTAERYFAKAHVYWMRVTNRERDSDDFLLNVSFVCEFILRGVVCSVNSSLNAANDEESMLFSAGVSPNKPPKTADLNTILDRAVRLIPTITDDEAKTLSALISLRNSELHGDSDAVSEASTNDVMPKIYSIIVKMAEFSGQDLAALLSDSDAIQARGIAEAILKDRNKRVRDLIKIQKDRFFGLTTAEQEAKREASRPHFISAVTTSGHHLKTYKCPACAELGFLGGNAVGRSAPILTEDGIFEELRIVPNLFECKCCELKINGLDELMAAGIEHEFRTLVEKDVVEHFNIDPLDYVDTEEIIREYQSEQYDYQDE